jgi:site-specific recombinase XerD
MSEIDWSRYPLISENKLARRWLQIQRDLGLAQNTVEAYGRGLEEYLAFVRVLRADLTQVTGEIIAAYVHSLRKRPGSARGNVISMDSHSALSNATMQLRLTVVRLFYDFLLEEQLCEKNPVGRGRYTPGNAFGSGRERSLMQRYHTLPWIPTEEDWHAILAAVRGKSTRVRLMFALSYDAALRREELCSIQVSDIDPAHRMIRIRAEATKNRLERTVPYSIHTSGLYQQYLAERRHLGNGRGRLFLSSSRRNRGEPLSLWMWSKCVKHLARESGVRRFTTHTLRHLRLTDLARAGWDVHEIATFAGHRNIQTTLGYIHLSGRELATKLERTLAEVDRTRLSFLAGDQR